MANKNQDDRDLLEDPSKAKKVGRSKKMEEQPVEVDKLQELSHEFTILSPENSGEIKEQPKEDFIENPNPELSSERVRVLTRKRKPFMLATFGLGIISVTAATTCYLLRAGHEEKKMEVEAFPELIQMHSGLTYTQLIPTLNTHLDNMKVSPGLAREMKLIEEGAKIRFPVYNTVHFGEVLLNTIHLNPANPKEIVGVVRYESDYGYFKEIPFIITPSEDITTVDRQVTEYHVGNKTYDTLPKAREAVDALVEARDIYKIDGVAKEFYAKADALDALANHLIEARQYNTADITPTSVGAFTVDGVTPVTDTSPVFRYNGTLYQTKDLAAQAWLHDHPVKIDAAKGKAVATVLVNGMPHKFDLDDFGIADVPTLDALVKRLSWRQNLVAPVGREHHDAIASVATFEIDGQKVTITRADGQPIDKHSFTIKQDPTQIGQTPVEKMSSTATFDIDGESFTLRRDDGAPISESDLDITVTTNGQLPATAVAAQATFEIDGQTVTATRADGRPITEKDIAVNTITPGAPEVSAVGSKATFTIDGKTVTVTRADGGTILESDITLSTPSGAEGVAPILAHPHTATFTVNGNDYTMTRADGGPIDQSMINVAQSRAMVPGNPAVNSKAKFKLNVNGVDAANKAMHPLEMHADDTSPSAIDESDIVLKTTQHASGDATPTYITMAHMADQRNDDIYDAHILMPDGSKIVGYAPQYYKMMYINRKGVPAPTDYDTLSRSFYNLKSISKTGTTVTVEMNDLPQSYIDQGWELVSDSTTFTVEDPHNRINEDWITNLNSKIATYSAPAYKQYVLMWLVGKAGLDNQWTPDKAQMRFVIKSNTPPDTAHPLPVKRMDKFSLMSNGKFYFKGWYWKHISGVDVAHVPPLQPGTTTVRDYFPEILDTGKDGAGNPLMPLSVPGTERLYQKVSVEASRPGITFTFNGQPVATPYEVELYGDADVPDLRNLIGEFDAADGTPATTAQTRQVTVASSQAGVVISGPSPIESVDSTTDAIVSYRDNGDGVVANAGRAQEITISVPSTMTPTPSTLTRAQPLANVSPDTLKQDFTIISGTTHEVGQNQVVQITATTGITLTPNQITFSTPATSVANGLLMKTWRIVNGGTVARAGVKEVIELKPKPGITIDKTSYEFKAPGNNLATKVDMIEHFTTHPGKMEVAGVNQAVKIIPTSNDVSISPQTISFKNQEPNIDVHILHATTALAYQNHGRPEVPGVIETSVDEYTLQLDGVDVIQTGTTDNIVMKQELIGFGIMQEGTHAPEPHAPTIVTTQINILQKAIAQVLNTKADAVGIETINDATSAAKTAIATAGATGVTDDTSLHNSGTTTVYLYPADATHAFLKEADAKAYMIANGESKLHVEKSTDGLQEIADHSKVYATIEDAYNQLITVQQRTETVTHQQT